jgi:glycosyltransferase 2 family protein
MRASSPQEGAAPASPSRKILWALVRLAIGAGLLAYLVRSRTIQLSSLSNLLTAWPVTLAAVALLAMDALLMALRLRWLFRPQGLHLSLGGAMQLTLVGLFFATFLPGGAGGDVARLYYALRENRHRRTEIATVLILDRAFGLFSMLLLPLLFAPLFVTLIAGLPALQLVLLSVAVLAACMLAVFVVCLLSGRAVKYLSQEVSGFPRWRNLAARVFETIRMYRESPGALVAALGISVLVNLSLIGVTALGVLVVNPSNLAPKMCLVVPIGYIVNSVPLTPGGLGVGETAFNALFHLTGLRGGAEAILCWRIWSAVVALGGFAIYLCGLKRHLFGTADLS